VPPVAQTSPGAQLAAVDELFAAELSKEPYAGVTGVVVSQGHAVWTKSYGFADIQNHMPASADTVYSMGSIGKQFTALMLLQLVDRHVVHLSDPVSMYVPELLQIQNPYRGRHPSRSYSSRRTRRA